MTVFNRRIPLTVAPAATSPGMPVCAVATAPSPIVRCPATPLVQQESHCCRRASIPKAHLRTQHGVFANLASVSHLHQIVDFRIRSNHGLANAGAVYAGVRLHLHPICQPGYAGLNDLVPSPSHRRGQIQSHRHQSQRHSAESRRRPTRNTREPGHGSVRKTCPQSSLRDRSRHAPAAPHRRRSPHRRQSPHMGRCAPQLQSWLRINHRRGMNPRLILQEADKRAPGCAQTPNRG